MAVKFGKGVKGKHTLELLYARCNTYNKAIKKYIDSAKGQISVPKRNLRELSGKFVSVEEYIASDDKWTKILDYDSSCYPFEDYVETLIRNWSKVKLILNAPGLPDVPKFNIVMSPKLQGVFVKLFEEDKRKYELNKKKVIQESSSKTTPSIDVDITSFIFYIMEYNDMSIDDILFTFRRDFSQRFLVLMDNLKEKGLSRNQIVEKFKKHLAKR